MSRNRITVIAENSAGRGPLLGEHGLAFWIEVADKRFLFDSGQGHVLMQNARHLGILLEETDAVVLSHGHYDHANGLPDALVVMRHVPSAYVHPAAFAEKYAGNPDGSARDVGMSATARQALHTCASIVPVTEPAELVAGLHLTGSVPRVTDFEDTGGAFFSDPACTIPDELPDDQAVFLETPEGTIVILGCAHSGIINTLQYILKLTHNHPIHTVVGGMHLVNAGPERLSRTVAELHRMNIRRLIPCHCTGFPATGYLWHEFPDSCLPCRVGTTIDLPGLS